MLRRRPSIEAAHEARGDTAIVPAVITLRAYQVAATPGRLVLWVGALYPGAHVDTPAPTVRFELDGGAIVPQTSGESGWMAADGRLLRAGLDGAQALHPEVWSAWVDLGQIASAGRTRQLRLHCDGAPSRLVPIRLLPAALRAGEGFSLLLASCFYRAESSAASFTSMLASAARGALSDARPAYSGSASPAGIDLTVLCGDQVYLDLPTLSNFPPGAAALGRKFAADYAENWVLAPARSGQWETRSRAAVPGDAALDGLLGMAPWIALADDHELWNNAPRASPVVENSWTPAGRDAWRTSAQALFMAFQNGGALTAAPRASMQPHRWRRLDVSPLSFFFCDSLWQRRIDPESRRLRLLEPATLRAITSWIDDVATRDLFGVFCYGQSLLSAPSGWFGSRLKDAQPADAADYEDLMQVLMSARRRHPLLLLAGDMHSGRIMCLERRDRSIAAIEVMSSPSTLVRTVGADELALHRSWRPWPRHSGPEFPIVRLRGGVATSAVHARARWQKAAEARGWARRGDHCCVIRFEGEGERSDGSAERVRIVARFHGELASPQASTPERLPSSPEVELHPRVSLD